MLHDSRLVLPIRFPRLPAFLLLVFSFCLTFKFTIYPYLSRCIYPCQLFYSLYLQIASTYLLYSFFIACEFLSMLITQ
ncbi:hypothetical protein BDW74DRAFT_152373 [Aspergillus multicolor]|uniref:uncharacterized protein n=1 Tax=Aspergillus multicolor TaxID=41759 RepID=UPI003CCDBAD9